jgi:hypothetical protein
MKKECDMNCLICDHECMSPERESAAKGVIVILFFLILWALALYFYFK